MKHTRHDGFDPATNIYIWLGIIALLGFFALVVILIFAFSNG